MNRHSPSKRRKLDVQRKETEQSHWLDADKIGSYDDLTMTINTHVGEVVPSMFVNVCEDHVLLYSLDHVNNRDYHLCVPLTVRILRDMSVVIFINDKKLPQCELNWALSHTNGYIHYWSQLDNVLIRYHGQTVEICAATKCKMVAQSIDQIHADTDDQQQTLIFLAEQLRLLYAQPKGRRYSSETVITAFTWYHKSPACYRVIRGLLTIPSIQLLRDISSCLNVDKNNSCLTYLKNKVKYLRPEELNVTLQLDEIHVKAKVSYQNGKLVGNACNKDQQQANRIQTFMISSVRSSNKDVIALVPVQKMTTADLTVMTK